MLLDHSDYTMAVLIVGGDRVAPYESFLQQQGYTPVRHLDGRRGSHCHRHIHDDTRLMVILVDYVNHSLARKMRESAKSRGVPVIHCRRCIGQLQQALTGLA